MWASLSFAVSLTSKFIGFGFITDQSYIRECSGFCGRRHPHFYSVALALGPFGFAHEISAAHGHILRERVHDHRERHSRVRVSYLSV